MPLYAPFGNAIFGETLFGAPPSLSINTTLTATPIGYDGLQIDWFPPGGAWSEQVLVRSSYGTPISVSDGYILLDETSGFSLQYLDSDLKPGHFYYYSLFVFSTLTQSWILAGSVQGLVLSNWGFGTTFTNWMPDWYLELDSGLATETQPAGPLVRYLALIGYEMDWVRSEIESLILLSDVDLISGFLLPYLGANYGMTYEPELGMTRSRVLVKNAVFLYKNRGTAIGIAAAGSAFTGFGCEVLIGPNLEIQLDDSAFDRSTGHWQSVNSSSSLSTIDAGSIGITPAHVSYNPVPALTTSGVEGYLPINNENLLLIQTHSVQLTWAQLSPTTSPGPRSGAAIANNPVLLFGGSGPGLLGDTWTWTGSNWQQLFPASSPSARENHMMAFDQQRGQVVLFGGLVTNLHPFTLSNETWVWGGNTWVKKTPANSPPPTTNSAMAYDPISKTVILFGGETLSAGLPQLFVPNNNTYAWNGTTWTQLSPVNSPPARVNASLAFDPVSNRLILFAGSDTWAWTGTNWTQLFPVTSPPGRSAASMVSFSSSVILTGGQDIAGNFLNDTWSWNGTTWTHLFPSTSPPVRMSAVAVSLPSGDVLLFGGLTGTGTVSDTWVYSSSSGLPPALSTCNSSTATLLGIPIPQQATPPIFVVSAYFRQFPEATPVARQFAMVIDWYDLNGVFISSTVGTAVTTTQGSWSRAVVVGSPPNGALTFGRTVKSLSGGNGDLQLMDAQQVEVNTQATPGPSPWQPPRDIKICLLPVRQNLVANPVGLGGTFGWSITNGSFVPSTDPVPWPAETGSGFKLTSGAIAADTKFSTTVLVNPEISYSFSCYTYAVAHARTVNLVVTFFSSGGTQLSSVQVPFVETVGSFVRGVNMNVTAPLNAVKATVTVDVISPTTSEVRYVGGLMFEPLSYLSPYFDGNFSPSEDYRFEGTPNQSISDYYPKLTTKLSRLIAVMPDYIPIGSTFSLVVGAAAFAAIGKNG